MLQHYAAGRPLAVAGTVCVGGAAAVPCRFCLQCGCRHGCPTGRVVVIGAPTQPVVDCLRPFVMCVRVWLIQHQHYVGPHDSCLPCSCGVHVVDAAGSCTCVLSACNLMMRLGRCQNASTCVSSSHLVPPRPGISRLQPVPRYNQYLGCNQ